MTKRVTTVPSAEVTMHAPPTILDSLADRIERAYVRCGPRWNPGCSAPGVWTAAAAVLQGINIANPTFPVDPELFVAAQVGRRALIDPWAELTPPSSAVRYRKRVREIIGALRSELRAEIQHANRRIRRGESIGSVVLSNRQRLSPLGAYIVALHAQRDDLADRLRPEAVEQHRSCPLYRQASRPFLPSEAYPVARDGFETPAQLRNRHAAWN